MCPLAKLAIYIFRFSYAEGWVSFSEFFWDANPRQRFTVRGYPVQESPDLLFINDLVQGKRLSELFFLRVDIKGIVRRNKVGQKCLPIDIFKFYLKETLFFIVYTTSFSM